MRSWKGGGPETAGWGIWIVMGALAKFEPENDFEIDILWGMQGNVPLDEVVSRLVTEDVFVSSLNEMQGGDNGFMPLLADIDGRKAIVAFSSLNRAASAREHAVFVVKLQGDQLILRTPKGMGLFLNPGFEAQMLLPADAVARIARELSQQVGRA
jgi:hypothetical protein